MMQPKSSWFLPESSCSEAPQARSISTSTRRAPSICCHSAMAEPPTSWAVRKCCLITTSGYAPRYAQNKTFRMALEFACAMGGSFRSIFPMVWKPGSSSTVHSSSRKALRRAGSSTSTCENRSLRQPGKAKIGSCAPRYAWLTGYRLAPSLAQWMLRVEQRLKN